MCPRSTRRAFVASLATTAGAAASGCLETLEETADGAGGQSDRERVGVRSIGWEGTTLVLQFDPRFDEWDGWMIHHEYEDPERDRVIGGQYPRTDQPQRLPFAELLADTLHEEYSTTTFGITAFEGYAEPWDGYGGGSVAWSGFGPSVTFEAPRAVLDAAGVAPSGSSGN